MLKSTDDLRITDIRELRTPAEVMHEAPRTDAATRTVLVARHALHTIIHGTDDRTVPFWHGEALYDAITARKQKLFVDGAAHTRLAEFTGQRYWDELKKFTDSL